MQMNDQCAHVQATRRAQLFATVPSAFVINPATPTTPPELNYHRLGQVLQALPSVQLMAESADLHALLHSGGKDDAFGLLRWVLSTNRSYMVPLAKEEVIEEMNTPHQFRLTLSSSSHAAQCVPSSPVGSSLCGACLGLWAAVVVEGIHYCCSRDKTPLVCMLSGTQACTFCTGTGTRTHLSTDC